MPPETESCSNPLVWPITRMCLRWTCFSCGGGGSEGSPAGSFWAAIKAARTGSKKKSNGAIRAGRKRSPSKHSFRDTVWHEGTLIGRGIGAHPRKVGKLLSDGRDQIRLPLHTLFVRHRCHENNRFWVWHVPQVEGK